MTSRKNCLGRGKLYGKANLCRLRCEIYTLIISTRNAETAKAIDSTIVALKTNFSKPLLVWWAELKLSPKAPPRPAAVCCIKMATVRSTAKQTCM